MQLTLLISNLANKWKLQLLVIAGIAFFSAVAYYGYQYKKSRDMAKGIQDIANNQERSQDVTIMLFAADWCGHCRKAKPAWDAFVSHYNNTVKNGRRVICNMVDCTDLDNQTSRTRMDQFGVTSYPTILMVKDGKIVKFDAAVTKDHLDQFIERML